MAELMASWPQQKAIWSICRRVCSGSPDPYAACDFDKIKAAAERGTLTRKKASDIIGAFYDINGSVFVTQVRNEIDVGFVIDLGKFESAERRNRTHKSERYTAPKKKATEYEDAPEKEGEAQPSQSPPKEPRGFQVGDRVEHTGKDNAWMEGQKGEVVIILDSSTNVLPIGVNWDNEVSKMQKGTFHDGHSCNGAAENGHGWFVSANEIVLIGEEHKGKSAFEPEEEKDVPEDEFTQKMKELQKAHEVMMAAKKKAEEEAKKFKTVTVDYVKPDIFDDVCLMIQNGVQVLLVGPSGCGKSLLIKEISKVLKKNLYVESFAGGKRYAQVFGSTHLVDGKSSWLPAEFLKAVQQEDTIVFMDEVMSADADVLIGCNCILDRKTRTFHTPDGVIEVNPKCVIVGASNVTGREYSQNYKGTQQQDASILNRFVHVHMDYDPSVEKNICKKSEIPKEDQDKMLGYLTALRKQININNISYDPSTRKLVQAIELCKMGMKVEKAFTYAFMTPLSEIEKKKVGVIC